MQGGDLVKALGLVNLDGGNDFGARTDNERIIGAVGCRCIEQVTMFGPHPLGVAVRDGRKQQEP